MHLDHVASIIVNAGHGIVWAAVDFAWQSHCRVRLRGLDGSISEIITAIAALMAECLWNDEYLIGPRIFCFAAGWVTAYVDVSPFRIEGADDVSGLARHRLSRWERRFGRERRRGAWFYFKRR